MKDNTKKVIAGIAITGTLIVGAFNLEDSEKTIPPFVYTIDEPMVNPENIRQQMELITAGGLYKDREIRVTVSKRTPKENRDVFKEFNVKIMEDKEVLTADDLKEKFEIKTK